MRMHYLRASPFTLGKSKLQLVDGDWSTQVSIEYPCLRWVSKAGDECVVSPRARDAVTINKRLVAEWISAGRSAQNSTFDLGDDDVLTRWNCAKLVAHNTSGRLWMLTAPTRAFSNRQEIVCTPARPDLWNILIGIALFETYPFVSTTFNQAIKQQTFRLLITRSN